MVDDGEIFIGGNNISDEDYRLEDTGILLEPVFFPYMSAYDNLAYYLKIHNKEQYLPEIEDTLELVGLIKNKDEKPTGFSFGMKQRLGLAQALIGHPKMLVLDEPAAGLDPMGREEMMRLIGKLHEDGCGIVMITHSMDDVAEWAKRAVVMSHGTIIRDETAGILFSHPRELLRAGLDVPHTVQLGMKLREKGLAIPEQAIGREDMLDAIVSLFSAQKGANANAE